MNAPRIRSAFARIAAAAVVAAAAAPAAGGVPQRVHAAPGDTVRGDVLFPGDFDEITFDAPRGARVSLSFRRQAPGAWTPYMGILGDLYAPNYSLLVFPTKALIDRPLEASGRHRLIVSGADGSTGGFEVRLALQPAKKFVAPQTGDDTPETFTFGAVAGAAVSVAISWKGPAPVTLASIDGPDGPVTSASAPRTTSRSSVQSGFTTTSVGDHVATFVVPEGTVKWSAKFTVTSPKPAPGVVRDLRTPGVPVPPGVEFVPGGDLLGFRVKDERGGPNDVLVAPYPAIPAEILAAALDNRAGGCATGSRETGPQPGSYIYRCSNGWTADVESVVRVGGRIVSFDVPSVRSPAGTGSVTVRDVTYDVAGRPATWTETRTYDATGHTHVIRVTGVVRASDGRVYTASIEHTDPDGNVRAIDYSVVSLVLQ